MEQGGGGEGNAGVEAGAKACPAWAARPPTKRAQLLQAAAEKMKAAVPELAKLLSQEQGKPLAHAVLEASRVQENLEYYAGLADKIRGDYVPLEDPGKFGLTLRRPIGVVVAITPWNFPLTLMANKICPALATGCTVVLKPASTTPLATQRAIEVINSAGFPPGVLNIVHGSGGDVARPARCPAPPLDGVPERPAGRFVQPALCSPRLARGHDRSGDRHVRLALPPPSSPRPPRTADGRPGPCRTNPMQPPPGSAPVPVTVPSRASPLVLSC